MTAPLHSLKHEHRVIERGLRALDGICTRLEWGEHVPPEVLSQLVCFISGYADALHHGKEETYLFPALQRQGIPRAGGPLGVFEQEHILERALSEEMRSAIKGYRYVDPEARQHFIDAARSYLNYMVNHIQNEDNILFRLADEILDDQEKDVLTQAFRQVEAEIGRDNVKQYEDLAAELERLWAV
jgi:hemerythrin-like domain-containing protein